VQTAAEPSVVKATAIVQPTAATAAAAAASNKRASESNYDDDEDVRSGKDQPVLRPKTTGPAMRSEQKQQPASIPEEPKKELTPKEKMLLNKLKKADAEAAKVG
jgi:hypothetical protein